MAMKNKYAKRARISEAKIREIVRYVAADLTALQAAALSGTQPPFTMGIVYTAVDRHGGLSRDA